MFPGPRQKISDADLEKLAQEASSAFWDHLSSRSEACTSFSELLYLSKLRKMAKSRNVPRLTQPRSFRIAILGSYSTSPLRELVEHLVEAGGMTCEMFVGEFDTWVSEILEADSALYRFRPDVSIILPASSSCVYRGDLLDSLETKEVKVREFAQQILDHCAVLHKQSGCEIILSNFLPSLSLDTGASRSKDLSSEFVLKKAVNLELGLKSQEYVQICDLEFLANRLGRTAAADQRAWYESKQIGSPVLLLDLAREIVFLIRRLWHPPKKVLVVDLDNTLWGGIIGEDGLGGIEIGANSPRGEAFLDFQRYLLALSQRGVLLAVCSKNELENAKQPFEKHPEMVLRLEHFVAFQANWNPKGENIRNIAAQLSLGLDSMVFIDDSPAEIENVRQFAPEVSTLLLDSDPSEYVTLLQESRFFEAQTVTREDQQRTRLYQQEAQRLEQRRHTPDLASYLQSLEMRGVIRPFAQVDIPRIAQLINKSNQFNLTTIRRGGTELESLMSNPSFHTFSLRLQDKFGDYGLVSCVIAEVRGKDLVLDTWVMSCRVLKRQVEEVIAREMNRLCGAVGCERLVGLYRPSQRNGMVRELYLKLGFSSLGKMGDMESFELDPKSAPSFAAPIFIDRLSS